MSDFDVAVTLAPGDADAHYNRGLTHMAMGRRHPAVKDLSRAIDLNPSLPDAHYQRGMAYRDMGRMDRALRDFDAAIELERGSASPSTPRGSPTSILARTRPRSATSTPS